MASVAGRVQIRIFSNTRALSRTLFGSQIRRQLCTDSPDDTPNTILEIKADTKVATLSLNRHSGKNAFSKAMIIEFKESLSNLLAREGTSEQVSCLIIKSNVEKVFCAGADLKERAGMSESEVGPFVSTLRDTFTFLAELPFPTIAAMEGVALGGGFELALACDLRIAGVNAKVGLPEVALAIIPGAGGTQRLTRIVGPAKAKELIFTSKILSAESALSCGLVTECVESGWAYSRAVEIADTLATTKGPIALRMAKRAVDKGIEQDIKRGLEIEKECYDGVIYTQDRTEGLAAFSEKRKPVYKSR